MRKFYILFVFVSIQCFAQSDREIEAIVAEGKLLYRSEMASWNGTDIFMDNYKNKENIGGYISYSEGDESKCVFVSRSENPKAIGTMTFDATFSLHTAKTDMKERDLTTVEKELLDLRNKARAIVSNDTLFKFYQNTSYNFIPLISKGQKKVYILTGPSKSGVVIFGNDYLLEFDKKNNLKSKKALHKNIIPIEYAGNSQDSVETIHNHQAETGDYITATDICTLMLYEKYANWSKHIVVSKKYMSVWDCNSDELHVTSMDAVQKISDAKKE